MTGPPAGRADGFAQTDVNRVLAGADQRLAAPARPDDPTEIRARLVRPRMVPLHALQDALVAAGHAGNCTADPCDVCTALQSVQTAAIEAALDA